MGSPVASFTMKLSVRSSIVHGGGNRRGIGIVLRRKTRGRDAAEHYLQVRLGRRSPALRHVLDDAPATQRSTYLCSEVLVALFQLRIAKHPFVFRNMNGYALADLRFSLAFETEHILQENFNERCYAAADFAHVFPVTMARAAPTIAQFPRFVGCQNQQRRRKARGAQVAVVGQINGSLCSLSCSS